MLPRRLRARGARGDRGAGAVRMAALLLPEREAEPLQLVKGVSSLAAPVLGMATLLALWALGGAIVANDPELQIFADLAPGPAFVAFADLVGSGAAWGAAAPPRPTPLSRPTGLQDSLTCLLNCLLDGWFVDWFDYLPDGWLVR